MKNTSGDMPMLSDLQLVFMKPRNSTQLLNINTTKFQVEREPVYRILYYLIVVFIFFVWCAIKLMNVILLENFIYFLIYEI